MADSPRYAWLDGQIVPWADAKIHVQTEAVFYGANVFEGVRAYWSEEEQQLFIFRVQPHLKRLAQSMKIMRMELPHGLEVLARACIDLVVANEYREDVVFRPTVYFGSGKHWAFRPDEIETGSYVTVWPRSNGRQPIDGIAVCVSSWRRIGDDAAPPRIKAGANYQNSRLATYEALVDGYDDAILLDQRGKVAEGPAACVFMVRDDRVFTPTVTDSILESVTRATLIDLFQRELGLTVVEREVDRTELYIADELLFCGTGYEITPIISVDRIPVGTGAPGAVTRRIQDAYYAIVRGRHPGYRDWLTPVWERTGSVARPAGEIENA